MTATDVVPSVNSSQVSYSAAPDLFFWLILFSLTIISFSMLIIFAKNMATKGEKIKLQPERYAFLTSYLNIASKGSILLGLIGASFGLYRAFILATIYGNFGYEPAISTVGNMFLCLVIGLAIAFVGFGLEFVSRWKSVVATSN